ncbi:hypothetical protein JXA02_01675 [candidate division KSB1 bacterium]|nr:hypothetical protein [candidate division KSB1 bacterium]RQW10763.1 MAG: hypothetical protein EH222_01775 [candidate division KSB1 bacterium]
MKYLEITIIVLFVVLLSCARRPEQPEQVILAQAGDRIITLDEYIKRAEYTIRPNYAKGNQYIHKKIILNSLIAEKLMAMEGGEDNAFAQNSAFQNYIRGRREQAMRKWLFHNEGTNKVDIKADELNNAYRWAGRDYDVAYFTVAKAGVDSVEALLSDPSLSFEDVYDIIGGEGELPTRQISWRHDGNDAVMEAMYSDTLRIGQVVGPLELGENSYTTMKVLGWTEKVAMSDEQVRLRFNDVKERLVQKKAEKIYASFVLDVMRGKTLEFDERAFYKVVEIVKPFYLQSKEEKQRTLNARLWQEEDTTSVDYGAMANDFEAIKEWPLLTIDGVTWTVAQLRDEIGRHPLVFRNRNVTDATFPQQFKLAVVDLVRDKYLTQEAYKRGYDRINFVEQYADMFRDHALALVHQNEYLKAQESEYDFSKDYLAAIDKYLNPYVDSLQTKYSDQIAIDTDILEKVELTRIDMFVMEKNAPYPVAVPSFPVLTNDTRLDYGRVMEKE